MKGYFSQLCVSGMTGDRSHQAKTTKHIQQKTSKKKKSPLSKKDKKFKKNKEEEKNWRVPCHAYQFGIKKKYLHPQHRHYQLNHHSVSLKEDLGSRMEKMEQRENTRANKPSKSASKTQRTRNEILGFKNDSVFKKRTKIRREDLS